MPHRTEITSPSATPETDSHSLAFPFSLGGLNLVALSDGFIDAPAAILAPEVPLDELNTFLVSCGEPANIARTPISCLLIRDFPNVGNILIDAGMGCNRGHSPVPIPTVNRLPEALAQAGIGAEAMDVILISHIHPDHVGGVFDAQGQPMFPNAVYRVPSVEIDFWGGETPNLSGTMMPPAAAAEVVASAKRFISNAGARLQTFVPGDDAVPGIESFPLPGHTPGQVGFLIRHARETILYTADAAGHPFISLRHPEWRFAFDTDAELAKLSRKALIERLVKEDWQSFTPHYPWPGVGVVNDEDGIPVWRPTF